MRHQLQAFTEPLTSASESSVRVPSTTTMIIPSLDRTARVSNPAAIFGVSGIGPAKLQCISNALLLGSRIRVGLEDNI